MSEAAAVQMKTSASRNEVLSSPPLDVPATPFDFRSPYRLQDLHLRVLRSLHMKFCTGLAFILHSKLQQPVSVDIKSIDQLFYGDYLPTTNSWQSLYPMRLSEVRASGILEADSRTVIAFVARLLGATDEGEIKSRRITKLEHSVIRGIVQESIEALSTAWKSVTPLRITSDGIGSDAEIARLLPTNEIIVRIEFAITLANQSYSLKMCYPAAAIEVLLSADEVGSHPRPGIEKEATSLVIMEQLEATRIEVRSVLGTASLTTGELLDLERGDILRLDGATSTDVELLIDGKTRFWGIPGVSNGRMAVKVTHTLGDDEHEGE